MSGLVVFLFLDPYCCVGSQQVRCIQQACASMSKDVWWLTSAPRLDSGVCLLSLILEAELEEVRQIAYSNLVRFTINSDPENNYFWGSI